MGTGLRVGVISDIIDRVVVVVIEWMGSLRRDCGVEVEEKQGSCFIPEWREDEKVVGWMLMANIGDRLGVWVVPGPAQVRWNGGQTEVVEGTHNPLLKWFPRHDWS